MSNATSQRIWAVVRLAVTLAAACAAFFGLTIDADALMVGASAALALVAFVWSWWKNNNITTAAIDAQAFLDIAKATEERADTGDASEDEDAEIVNVEVELDTDEGDEDE